MVIITVIMVLCLGISLQGRKMSESQQVVRLSSLIPWDLGHAEQSSALYPVSLEYYGVVGLSSKVIKGRVFLGSIFL